MADLGYVGSYGLSGLQQTLRQRAAEEMARKQKEFENQIALRSAGRQDLQLQQQGELQMAQLKALQENRAAVDADRVFKENMTLQESIPGGREMSAQSPIAGRLMAMGAAVPKGIEAETPPMLAAPGQAASAELPGTVANAPSLTGRMIRKLPSQKQLDTDADNARQVARDAAIAKDAEARLAESQGRDRETGRHNRAMETKPSGFGTVVVQGPTGPLAVDKRTGTSKPVTDAEGNQVGQAPTTLQRNTVAQYAKAKPVFAAISELSEKINVNQGVYAKMAGGAARLAAKANLDDDVAEYESLVQGFTPLVARALGHVGVLTEPDVQSTRAVFPKPGDSKNLRDRKIKRIEQLMRAIEAAPLGNRPKAETPEAPPKPTPEELWEKYGGSKPRG